MYLLHLKWPVPNRTQWIEPIMMKPKIRLKISDVKVVPLEILRRNQEDLEKIKRQKREWYHRNKKKVLKQQKTSERKKEYLKEWYQKNNMFVESIG